MAYADAVHEKNAQNEWIEIDNTLVSENNRIENNSESFHTSFSETANPVAVLSANAGELLSNNVADNSESQLVSIESGEHRLSWSLSAASMLNTQQAGQLQQQGCVLENTSNDSPVLYQSEQFIGALPAKHLYQHSLSSLSEAEIKNNINSQQEETNYQKTIATKAVSSVLYQNAFGDKVDLQYTVAPSKIKEDVILRESSAFRSYTMNVDTNGLTAVKSENNTVEFLKTDGTSVFTIQTPYMYDSADECSYDIDIIIEQTGNIASVTYTPDSNWINSGERVYPITIDPSVQAVSSLNRSSISDTYVHEGNGSCCSGINPSTHDRLYIGRKGNRIHRAYFKINTLPTIVSGSYINQAEVYAQCYNGTTTSKPFSINKVTSSWNDSTLGWSPQPASTDIQGGVERNTNYNVIQFNNCRAAIASLYNGNMANNGFMIHYTSETDNDYNSIYSYENANTSGCPYMVIYYTSPAGIATGTYYIRNKHSGHYLDAENKGGSGTNVLQYAFNGSTNQQWKIERQSNGLYVLKAVYNTGLALDVNNASESNSANIQVYNFNNSSAQQWYIIENNDGGYRILSRCSNGQKCVTVQNASTASGANVFQYDYTDNAGENDEWWLIPIDQVCLQIGIYSSSYEAPSALIGGHSFLSFKNISSFIIPIGPILLQPNEEMTLTKWWQKNSNDSTIHAGIWYNRDTAISNTSLSRFIYITENITGCALVNIENYIKTHDSYHLINNNCCTLSTDIWNEVCVTQLGNFNPDMPAALMYSIAAHDGQTGKTFAHNPTKMGYMDNGNFIISPQPKEP